MGSELVEKIERLRKERNAVILAHNYQLGEVQDIADFTGDSLGLSIQAAATKSETIVFCGVLFMAQTAAILSPNKTVLLPEIDAGCPMADMITAPQLQELKDAHPEAIVVCYVNSSAPVKALCDYCCTSSNAVEVVRSIPADREIIFVPDRYLGQHVIDRTGREMVLWPGYCPTHAKMDPEDIELAKKDCPEAIVMAHPECNERIRALADEILSTGQMLEYVRKSDAKCFIVATEVGILHTLRKQSPEKLFIAASQRAVCPNMKKINLEKIAWSLEDMRYRITVDKDIADGAKAALDRMLEILPGK